MTSNQALKELTRLSKTNPKIFEDKLLFYMAMLMLTYYKYKWSRRRNIYQIFSNYMNKKDVFEAIDI